MSSFIQSMANRKGPYSGVRLNLGCGAFPIGRGYVNIDRGKTLVPEAMRHSGDYRFLWHDLREGIPYEDSTVDYIVCHHFLEHLTYEQGADLLDEAARVLRKGGAISIVTPDFGWLVQAYLHAPETIKQTAPLMLFCEGPEGDRHRSAWDRTLLTRLVWGAGFKVEDASVNELPHLTGYVEWQCGILATKK